jgi:hypothetical protein
MHHRSKDALLAYLLSGCVAVRLAPCQQQTTDRSLHQPVCRQLHAAQACTPYIHSFSILNNHATKQQQAWGQQQPAREAGGIGKSFKHPLLEFCPCLTQVASCAAYTLSCQALRPAHALLA